MNEAVTRTAIFKAIMYALEGCQPINRSTAAQVGAEACLMVLAMDQGCEAAAAVAYELADLLATGGKKK
jgi:hypothetical protein